MGNNATYFWGSVFPTYSKLEYNKEGSLLYLGNEENPYLYLADVEATDAATITEIAINENCRIIGEKALAWCKSVTEISLPDSVVAICNNAFENCSSLTKVTVGDNLVFAGANLFYNSEKVQYNEDSDLLYIGSDFNPYVVVVGTTSKEITEINVANGCRVIANTAFTNCKQVKSATLPEGIVTIGKSAFNNCQKLSSVNFPNSVEVIGESAFVVSLLTEVDLGDNVTFIGKWAFSNCYYIRNITLGRKVERMEYAVFAGCKFLESFTYEGTVEEFKQIKIDVLISWESSLNEISCLDGSLVID
jgi:hypothetical protein